MEPFSWTCPYCNRGTTVTEVNSSTGTHIFNKANKDADLALVTVVVVCPHPKCREYEIRATLFKTHKVRNGYEDEWKLDASLTSWTLKPKSNAKQFPSYIPKAILDDYQEACLIIGDSPKASATLCRRCLQGAIRDFWKITDKTLALEINALKGKIDSTTWAAIDAVRGVGNIGAHMEKDINLIIDVEATEAELLVGLIEFLLKDWYVGRYEREEHMKQVIALGAEKAAAKKASTPVP